ncbi:hypothetical protein QBC41DRAFT_324751 [Cercophora samala]|uniref:Amine oxidase domain-containing protein n=1 Tax=Cercophora samala TaxID=330535 RepID=A0AA39Z9Y8_9PEZI|nr:hypothetical protein QBC41DRAFT_324751 [Cercophora samala]
MEKRHICIIGAGISGLRCADILLSKGFKVTILEARDRIGGRICQSNELGYTVDIGPNWIHAWTDSDVPHPIYKLATDTNTPLHRWNTKQLIYDSSGKTIPEELTERLSTTLWDIISQAFKFSEAAHVKDGGNDIPATKSLQDFIREKAEEVVPDAYEQHLLIQMSEMFGAYVGEPVWKQSLRFSWMEECCGGEEMFVASNYSAILDLAAKPAVTQADIRLNTRVVNIKSTAPDKEGEERDLVTITTDAGDLLSFNEVVVTTPLGYLKQNHATLFTPELPQRLVSAIDNISLSQLEKVFITFPTPFWKNNLNGGDEFPSYTNWLSPLYPTTTNPSSWPQEIWDLSSFAAPNNHPTILFYLYGDCSRHIVNLIHDKPQHDKHQLLQQFFEPYYSLLPGYNVQDPNCVPKAILATEWLKDELNGYASYCNFQVGVEEADKDVLAIREGCVERGLWFCGEHAAPFEECGTVAGAYLSGESVGKRIAELYKAESNDRTNSS